MDQFINRNVMTTGIFDYLVSYLWIGYHSKCSALIICVPIFKIYLTSVRMGQLVIERSSTVLNRRGLCVINSNITIQ
jgi:hypothetical protein